MLKELCESALQIPRMPCQIHVTLLSERAKKAGRAKQKKRASSWPARYGFYPLRFCVNFQINYHVLWASPRLCSGWSTRKLFFFLEDIGFFYRWLVQSDMPVLPLGPDLLAWVLVSKLFSFAIGRIRQTHASRIDMPSRLAFMGGFSQQRHVGQPHLVLHPAVGASQQKLKKFSMWML